MGLWARYDVSWVEFEAKLRGGHPLILAFSPLERRDPTSPLFTGED